ncbi:MAG: sulfatase-like hydrolase/transferase [Planctomycetaceae bacterium]|nr:sulfatase-like hydrolase/transferase [Planctomycetaceae bacterium]
MNAICLVVDRLHASHLGAYGNAWIETPCLDRLAAQSLVFDRALIDSPRLDRLYRSYWHGLHAMCPAPADDRPSLASLLRTADVHTALLTDDVDVARHPLAADFDELVEIDPPWTSQTAEQMDQTQLARCCVEIIRWLESAREPFLLWCHLGSLGTTWDAPLTYRRAYVEPGDPTPPDVADVPDRRLPPDHDPDERLGLAQAYAGQVTLLDTCLGALLECLDGLPSAGQTLLSLSSARGFPLGEHLRVGPCDDALYGELVQVPWLLRLPDQRGRLTRSASLVEPTDLWATLLDYWSVEPPPSPTAISVLPQVDGRPSADRDRLCMINGAGRRAIRTPAWHLRLADPPELFVKPDDRWEVNDVASRCREVAECLEDALEQFEWTVQTGTVADLPPLDEVLRNGFE